MKCVPVSRLSDQALDSELKASVAHDCTHTARQVALIAEFDKRKLYRPAGYASMFTFCVGELHLSEDAAYRRIHVARAARRYPGVLAALAQGRVHLSGLTQLARYLSPATADELLAAATHRSKAQIERLLAERFPRPDLVSLVRAIPQAPTPASLPAAGSGPSLNCPIEPQVVAIAEGQLVPGRVEGPVILSQEALQAAARQAEPRARVAPLAPQRYGVQFTVDQAGHDLLRHVQDLLGHQVARGDLEEVFVRALRVYAAQLEKQKLAATEQSRAGRRPRPGSRHIPAHVKRAVWERDGGQCTFVSDSGHRCEARRDIEWDHIEEFARGGEATVGGIRLRCRAHNQYTAERTFGAGFMSEKRVAARRARAAVKARRAEVVVAHDGRSRTAAAQMEAEHAPGHVDSAIRQESESSEDRDVVPWLRGLGYSAAQARHAAESIECDPDASLEQRLRLALKALLPPHRTFDFRRQVTT